MNFVSKKVNNDIVAANKTLSSLYTVESLTNETNTAVDEYVKKNGTIYHLTKWSILIKKVFNHNSYYFYARDNDNSICGVLPVVHIKSMLFGNYMISMPYFNYGSVIADNSKIEEDLIQETINTAYKLNVSHIEFRDIINRDSQNKSRQDKVNMILELPPSIDELSNNLGSKLRSQIRRPLRENITVEIGDIQYLDDFYTVFSENMRDLGTPVYTQEFFREILLNFSDNCKIIVLYKETKPISAAFLIGFNEKLEIPWASTIKRFNKYSPNMLLYWEVLKFAILNKYKLFDFGRSTIDSGTYRFKKQWGAIPKQLYWHYWLNNGVDMPNLSPNNPKYKFAIMIWKRLPLLVTNSIGPLIVKNLP